MSGHSLRLIVILELKKWFKTMSMICMVNHLYLLFLILKEKMLTNYICIGVPLYPRDIFSNVLPSLYWKQAKNLQFKRAYFRVISCQ